MVEFGIKQQRKYYGLFGLAAIIYILTTLAGPLSPNRFNLTPSKTHFLQATIALPVVIIWSFAVYGAVKFKSYTSAIKKDADGKALDGVATGLSILVASYIINGLFSTMRAWAFRDGWLPKLTIISNYIAVILALTAFMFMYKGSCRLSNLTKRRTKTALKRSATLFLMLIVAILYIVSLLTYKYRNSTPDAALYSSFYMPDALILITLAVPYLLGWALGIMTCFNVNYYQRHVKGRIYRSGLLRVATGILLVVIFSIILQMLVAFSTFFARQNLAGILLFIYLILIMYGAGFLTIASGARRLNAIEEAK